MDKIDKLARLSDWWANFYNVNIRSNGMLKIFFPLGVCLILAGCGGPRQAVMSTPVVPGPAEGKETLIEVEAESLIAPVKDNILATREQGVEAAKRNAIEKAIGVWVTGQQIVQQAALIEEKIFSKVGGYIKDYKVLSQGPDGEFYKTKLWASVKQADIRKQINDLGLLLQTNTVNNPRVVVLVEEYINDKLAANQTAATVIMGELLSKEYKVVDQEQLDKIKTDDRAIAALKGDEKAAAQIARKFDADIAVVGKVTSTVKPNPYEYLKDTLLSNTVLNLKVVKTTTGDALYAVNKSASTWDLTGEAASAKATVKVAEEASRELAGTIAAKLYESVSVLITVNGLTNLNRLEDFRKAVRYFDGVSEARTRDFLEGSAQIELTLKYGNAQLIAAKLESLKDWNLKVTEAGGHIVKCTVAK